MVSLYKGPFVTTHIPICCLSNPEAFSKARALCPVSAFQHIGGEPTRSGLQDREGSVGQEEGLLLVGVWRQEGQHLSLPFWEGAPEGVPVLSRDCPS